MEVNAKWRSLDTLNKTGSEEGTILQEEEDVSGIASICLERDTSAAPYAIICGIGGNMVHTRFFGDKNSAFEAYQDMKSRLADIVKLMARDFPDDAEGFKAVSDACSQFIEMYP